RFAPVWPFGWIGFVALRRSCPLFWRCLYALYARPFEGLRICDRSVSSLKRADATFLGASHVLSLSVWTSGRDSFFSSNDLFWYPRPRAGTALCVCLCSVLSLLSGGGSSALAVAARMCLR